MQSSERYRTDEECNRENARVVQAQLLLPGGKRSLIQTPPFDSLPAIDWVDAWGSNRLARSNVDEVSPFQRASPPIQFSVVRQM